MHFKDIFAIQMVFNIGPFMNIRLEYRKIFVIDCRIDTDN